MTINTNFIGAIKEELLQHHEVLQYSHTDDRAFNYQNIRKLMDWADVAYFDFCQFPFTVATRMIGTDCKIVVRLAGLEIYRWPQLKIIDWSKVDHMICLTTHANRKLPEVKSISFLPVGTNIELFKPLEDKKFGFNICMVGSVLPRKRVYTTVQTLAPLLKNSPAHFWIHSSPGGFRDTLRLEYTEQVRELIETLQIGKKVHWHEWSSNKSEYAKWLQTMDVIISNSTMEGYHKAIFDAMACGVYPLVNCWLGAHDLFPPNHIFTTQEELRQKLIKWDQMNISEKKSSAEELRRFVVENHDEKEIAKKIRLVIENVAN